MGTSSIFLCVLFLCGALGLTMSPARGRLRCYICGFTKPCHPVPTECQDDEACGISIGTSGRTLVQCCLSRAQCPLPGYATYWLHSYTLWHHCSASPQQLTSLLASLPLFVASFAGRGHLLH
uniref:LY6E n=1 Tax=Pan troglodytes TaxID=9598 RepID=A0A2I3SRC3_PANTR